jgi:exosortase
MKLAGRSKGNSMKVNPAHHRTCRPHVRHLPNGELTEKSRWGLALAVLVLGAVAVWSHWSTLVGLLNPWKRNDDYSAGLLVPLAAAFLVWRERKTLTQCHLLPCWREGIALLVFAEAVSIYGVLSLRFSLERYALVLTTGGLVLMVAGREVFRRIVWVLPFLLLMVPFPGRLHAMISEPLQRLATNASVLLLEVIVPDVSQEGNIVILGEDLRVAVTEACSGLRMLTAFIILAAYAAYVVKRSPRQKAVLLAMSIPVAVICNVLRISLTGVLAFYVSEKLAEKFFHDLAGLVMMPAAVSLLFAGLWLMDRLVAPETVTQEKLTVVRTKSARAASPKQLPA